MPTILDKPLPNFFKGWSRTPWMVVLHYSATHNAERCHNVLRARKLSVHATIERDGVIWRQVSDDNRCIHAGYGQWGGHSNVNHHSFGIEIANLGWVDGEYIPGETPGKTWDPEKSGVEELEKDPSGRIWYREETWGKGDQKNKVKVLTRAESKAFPDHRSSWWRAKEWPLYPERQINSVFWLVWQWVKKYQMIPENVVGHEHVTPARKSDPGLAFPWDDLAVYLEERCKEEMPILLDPDFKPRERVKCVQSHLNRMGLPVGDIDGWWGTNTASAAKEAVEKYGETYGFADVEVSPDNIIELGRVFRRVPGFDPGRS